ncbi:MAG: glucose 1-dehydrogenase [Dehalococcoidia bacterium]|jgi:NAD(P)-dependent dehydrogenase (short-subunit alcohol dehydrogenase family)|nr:glucose 1-dehydrogenase [Dehalococcoidia bacterium]
MEGVLKGKVALVTGGSSGIGRAAAVKMGEAGAKVVVSARRESESLETVRMVEDVGGEGVYVKADVSVRDDVSSLIADVVSAFGRLDCAFNNAGDFGSRSQMHETSDEEFDRMIATNLRSVWLSMKHEIAQMLRQGSGAIVNNASISGYTGIAGFAPYAAAKHGVIGLTRSAARGYAAQSIRVNAICPGFTDTDMLRVANADDLDRVNEVVKATVPARRLASPDEVADVAVWLCTDSSSYVNGALIPVDGARTA